MRVKLKWTQKLLRLTRLQYVVSELALLSDQSLFNERKCGDTLNGVTYPNYAQCLHLTATYGSLHDILPSISYARYSNHTPHGSIDMPSISNALSRFDDHANIQDFMIQTRRLRPRIFFRSSGSCLSIMRS